MADHGQTRRTFLQASLAGAGAFVFGVGTSRFAFGAPATTVASPYGPLQAPDVNGPSLPPGFTSRKIAQAGQVVPGTGYTWHATPDGGAGFTAPDGGWDIVSN